ncbi:bactofilin family protein [Natronococcus occultus]|uniref:Integral membrane protein CcmA involved in cell shape determination n=1 Tax=Natronococcus occultus SP4 TaxID=694430 RepID=L0JT41_9EURY|nr:polymer-forming cytoskeletal protein [Natronococcus occultus]AGB35896.1 Integral membrane protein CcmA involved in cell shape determination [Natronococcus occultus SP4]
MASETSVRKRLAIVLLVVVLLGAVPTGVVAQSESTVGGTAVVAEDETIDELEAVAGTVVVEGTVTGDVSAAGGDVRIAETGEVGGSLEGAAGSVTIDGTVDGDVGVGAGNVEVGEDATVGGEFTVGAGNAVIDGVLEGDAAIGAETITLGSDAEIAGDLRYDGDLQGNTDAVAGSITEDSTLGVDIAPTLQPLASWLASVYVLALNLLLGAALLALFPRFSDGVADRVSTDPVRTGLVGLGVLVGVPILLVAVAITIVGIPFSIVGGFAFAFVVWIGIVYGRFAVAAWLLSYADLENRWLALVVGLIGGAVLSQVPYLGGLVDFLVLLLGLGALAWGLYARRRTARTREPERRDRIGPDEPASD